MKKAFYITLASCVFFANGYANAEEKVSVPPAASTAPAAATAEVEIDPAQIASDASTETKEKVQTKIIKAEDARAYATENTEGVVVMTLKNEGTLDQTITGVKSEIAESAELSMTYVDVDGSFMGTQSVPSLGIVNRADFPMTPKGYYIALKGLKKPLKAGSSFPIELIFKDETTIKTDVKVVAPDEEYLNFLKEVEADAAAKKAMQQSAIEAMAKAEEELKARQEQSAKEAASKESPKEEKSEEPAAESSAKE